MKKIYNKLVRDLIPEIIENDGKSCSTEILTNERFLVELDKKLQEEVNEYLESGSVEEIADILEVIDGIILAKGISKEDILAIKEEKKNKRGGFEKKIFLESVIEKD